MKEKEKKLCLPAFSPLSTMLPKAFMAKVVNNLDCMVTG